MKFELIEIPHSDAPENAPEQSEDEIVQSAETGGDPAAALSAATARLAADARAEGERIDASLAELAAIVHESAPRWQGTKPPRSFRAVRFSKGDVR